MDKYKTQFIMSDVPTDVQVQQNADGTFACTLMLVDYFEGEEHTSEDDVPDVTIKLTGDTGEVIGESKITLSPADLQSLAQAIRELGING